MPDTILPQRPEIAEFIQNKYHRWYDLIIENARSKNRRRSRSEKTRDYFELHHAIPRSLGGSDDKDNLVLLTAREHYVVHWLLMRFTSGEARAKMAWAFKAMNHFDNEEMKRDHFNSRAYEEAKKNIVFTEEHRRNIGSAGIRRYKNMSEEERRRLSEQQKEINHKPEVMKKNKEANGGSRNAMYGKPFYVVWEEKYGKEKADLMREEHKKKISHATAGENNPRYGVKFSPETRSKISKAATGRKAPNKIEFTEDQRRFIDGWVGTHVKLHRKFNEMFKTSISLSVFSKIKKRRT